jgi:hypothetical protein
MVESFRNSLPPLTKILLYLVVAIGLLFFLQSLFGGGLGPGLAIAVLPLVCFCLFFLIQKPVWAFFFLFVVNYLIMGIGRYIQLPIPAGIMVDICILFAFLSIAFRVFSEKNSRDEVYNPLFFLSLTWLIYCIIEIVNPESNILNWATSVRSIGVYFFLFVLLTTLLCKRYKLLKQFILLWSILVLLAAIKGIGQKMFGLDTPEKIWLYTIGAHTHLIYSGIRYFSFFTDAANFGCHMGLGMVVFSIIAIYTKSIPLKVYYVIVAIAACYGMMISGTRAAMAVPFVGLACFIFVIRQWKWIILGGILFVAAFSFFNFTTIGEGNTEIRRMRTAFIGKKDASFNVRVENQRKMKQFMNHYPFGLGIGSAKHAEEGDLLHGLPTDTSFVYVWVETGIVGLILYLGILLSVLVLGMYYVMVKLKHPEIRGITCALTAGLAGMLVAGYGNEVLHQFPTGPTLYICMAFIMLSPRFDKELMDGKHA